MARNRGGLVSAVAEGSVGAEIGIEPGDRLLAINGTTLRDEIDYRFYGAEDELELVVERGGERHVLEVERDYDEELGLSFAEPVFDGMRLCKNHCPFCFVGQLPRGLRRTLYLKDDDYRYSFLSASYVTLTNLSEADWRRIGEQHLSPLYVSIHASDLAVRRALLANPAAPDVLAQIRRLGELGIAVHGQIVVSPGWNDGQVLWRTIEDVAGLWPVVRTVAVVPVGLTSFHCEGMRLLTAEEAAGIADGVLSRVVEYRRRFRRTWLYPSDELLLAAGRDVPPAAFYDDPAQYENGVGMVRALLDDWAKARKAAAGARDVPKAFGSVTLVSGMAMAPILAGLSAQLAALTGVEVTLVPVENTLLGASVTVSGLLGGEDVLAALAERPSGELVCIPRAMLDEAGARTLDEITPAMLSERLGVPVAPVRTMRDVLNLITGGLGRLAC